MRLIITFDNLTPALAQEIVTAVRDCSPVVQLETDDAASETLANILDAMTPALNGVLWIMPHHETR